MNTHREIPRRDLQSPSDAAADRPRTFVISDAHGYPELITNALEHGGFRPGVDGFVYAGDFVDRGPDAAGCLELIDRHATEVVFGNHDLAVLLGFRLWEQTAASRALRPALVERLSGDGTGRPWRAVGVVDGVLISHGGISSRYQRTFEMECASEPLRLAERLNKEFAAAVQTELRTGDWDEDGVLGDEGPLWFRPRPWSSRLPLDGATQVVGHTPPLPELAAHGFHMVDPCAFQGLGDPRRYRYAMIEGGRVQVLEGSLAERSAELEVA